MSEARILHNGSDIRKIQVNKTSIPNQVRNGLHSLAENIIGNLKGIGKCNFLIGSVLEPLIRDNNQRIHLSPQLLNTALGLLHPAAALEAKGLCHNANCQNIQLFCQFRHNGSRSGASAAAHAGGNKHHVRLLQSLGYLIAALLRRFTPHLRVRTCALSMGQLLTNLYFIRRAGNIQRLFVRIYSHKVHALCS